MYLGLRQKPKPSYQPTKVSHYGDRVILNRTQGNNLIKEIIESQKPSMICRFGAVELSAVVNYLQIKDKKVNYWYKDVLYSLENNAGFFPANKHTSQKFAEIYLECIKDIDLLGAWYNEGEDWITEKFCPNAHLAELESIEPYYHQIPWSVALEGKNVLVIHPFSDSIQKQFTENRENLFEDKNILPKFNLKVIKAVQSIADNKKEVKFKDWFEALEYMQNEITKVDFDVAIIGAGAYGLPLAHFIKKLGKQAIHLGGATQILFGVFGNRWKRIPIINEFQNEYWIRPAQHEIPKGAEKVEGSCYW
ncbi:MAG: hypothetical protein EAZ85_00400 [Bacteroidetes bacterium]|nr:MAG: hypothetical protein EAZ85_00400 [Bacteroidota bacterium]TAG90342.1 MAG: hypothetical protein EAZ20_04565 [Bacteroidota bacterium]